jgi:hypothetical protein
MSAGVTVFTMGEEVLYDGERYVIWGASDDEPLRYRLLATSPQGARIVWALPETLEKMTPYTKAWDDTAKYR